MHKIIQHYQHCPNCGEKLTIEGNSAICPSCIFNFYLNPAPCVTILIVNKQNQVLWTKRGIEPQKDFWDLPGGFIEPGETVEQATLREAKEELNLDIEVIKILTNTPDVYGSKWGQPTLNFIVHCKIIQGELRAQDDVASTKWIDLDTPPEPIGFDNAKVALKEYKK